MASLNNLNLQLLDANGTPIAFLGGNYLYGGKREWIAPASGRFYLRASSDGLRVQYRVMVTTPENDPEPAVPLAMGQTVKGEVVTPGEAQRVRIDVEAGEAYALDIRGDSEWSMIGTDGVWKWSERIPNACHTLVWKAEESGSYFIEMYNYYWGDRTRYSVGFSQYDGPLDGKRVDCQKQDNGELAQADDGADPQESDQEQEPKHDDAKLADAQLISPAQSASDEEEFDDSGDDWLSDDYEELDFGDQSDWGLAI
jgi:hypothetical protein